MSLFHRYNNENVLMRAVMAGLLDVLNNKIQYRQAWADDDLETINVPWYYNQSGDERFMQDFYTHYAHCGPKPVDGNMDQIPRGVITYTGSAIDEQRITNRFVQGNYVKDIDGILEQYVSYLYSIPLNVRFDAELWVDTHLTALKIEQEIREVFFKNVTFYVYYKGLRVGCTAGFPSDVVIDKNINYSFESDNKIKLNFSIEVESYQPVFDPTTEMLAANKMKGIGYRLYTEPEGPNDGQIQMVKPSDNLVVPKGIPLWLEWIYTKEAGIMSKVSVYWLNYQQNERNTIEIGAPNYEFYVWNIPETFTNFKEPAIIWEEDPSLVSVVRNPVLKIVPNTDTGEITESSFYAIQSGYFRTPDEDSSINILLEMKDDDGKLYYSEQGKVWANIKYNQLDSENPVSIASDTSIFFPGTVDYKVIDLQIANAVNTDVFGIVNKLKIV